MELGKNVVDLFKQYFKDDSNQSIFTKELSDFLINHGYDNLNIINGIEITRRFVNDNIIAIKVEAVVDRNDGLYSVVLFKLDYRTSTITFNAFSQIENELVNHIICLIS